MALDRELATYNQRLEEFKPNTGKFVLIHGEEVVDFFTAYDDALKAGYNKFGLESFLVKQINSTEAVQYITRRVIPSGMTRTA